MVTAKGETAFNDFNTEGSKWRKGDKYIFVLDEKGMMLVHPDAELQGRNQMSLKDVNGKPIIAGLIETATSLPEKQQGWYHYEWPVPGGLLPRWKSSYVQLVESASGRKYIVGCGIYNDIMEREFVVDMVRNAVGQIEKKGVSAFELFRDSTGPFLAKDAYVFVIDTNGNELVNPAFPNLEGRNVLDLKDTKGKMLTRAMFDMVRKSESGWVDYMWPKPGESVSTKKSTYVSRAKMGNNWVLVGCGVYLADAPKEISKVKKMTASELMTLVNEAATVFEQKGENAYPEFRKKGSKWFKDDTYFFVWTLDGTRIFHAATPEGEGKDVSGLKDVLGRPIGKMFLEAASASKGEGWVHYLYPEPGDIFPIWKSSYVKKVKFPSGKQYIIGCGVYNMQMDKVFIEDIVNRASNLVEREGKGAFAQLRDKKGPFIFLDTYVFVNNPEGVELVNAAQPSLEGKNMMGVKDVYGKFLVRDYINAAMKNGSAWTDYYWYKPGESTPVRKHTFVKKVVSGKETYIVGSGYYEDEDAVGKANGKR